MKSIAIIFSMLTFFAFSSNAQSENIKKIMDNPETRIEIYNNIMNDHERMVEFMEIANGNEHTTMMMQNKKHQIMNSQKDVSEMNCNHQMMDSLNTTGKKKFHRMNYIKTFATLFVRSS